jgi:pSer/pThr/pTyr-binding forkhead associated (FHA) protein
VRLIALSGPYAGRAVPVPGTLTIGRSLDRALCLSDPKVSRQHATVWKVDGGLHLRDDGSLNGTWVNDQRIVAERSLRNGDRVRIGGSEFLVNPEQGGFSATERHDASTPVSESGERRETVIVVGD